MAQDSRERRAGVTPGAEQEAVQRSLAENIRLGAGIALIAALVLFVAQNFEDAEISFLWFDPEIPLAFALIISALVGALAAWLFSTFRGRAARRREQEMFDAAMKGSKR